MDRINSLLIALQSRRQDGQAMVEYGLILGLVSVVAVATLTLIGTDVNAVFVSIEGSLAGAV
jgi:pilus assembly protein Flp/PilA